MRRFGRLLPVDRAVQRMMAAARPVQGTEVVPLSEAVGRVAAENWRAPRPVPDFSRATWDGYAVRSRDTLRATRGHPVELRVVGEVFAEQRLLRPIGAGEAAAIATGGALPRGADAVAIFEDVIETPGRIGVPRFIPRGERVAVPGDDFPRGTRLVSSGDPIDPARVGALAATGRTAVRVHRRPRVALLANGNEVVSPGRRLRPGQIYEVNNVTLSSVVRVAGGVPTAFPPVTDDARGIERAIRRALRGHDVVIVTGGSSVGEHDYLPAIFPRLGRLLFHGVAVRPGKPTLAASRGPKLLLGLPGHPTSCLSNGFWMVLPVLRRISHLPGPGWVEATTRLLEPLAATSETLSTVVPLHVTGRGARTTFKDSSAITSLAGANAYLLRPPGSPGLARGSEVRARVLPAPLGAPLVP